MRQLLIIILLALQISVQAQAPTGIIYPAHSFTNQSSDTLFYLSKSKIEVLMEREELHQKLIKNLETQNILFDSINNIREAETEKYFNRLLETDKLLENCEINVVRQKQNARLWNKIWFGVGVVGGWVVFGGF